MATKFKVVELTETGDKIARYYKQKDGKVKQIWLPAITDETGKKVVNKKALANFTLPFYIELYIDPECKILDPEIAIEVQKD